MRTGCTNQPVSIYIHTKIISVTLRSYSGFTYRWVHSVDPEGSPCSSSLFLHIYTVENVAVPIYTIKLVINRMQHLGPT